MLVGGAPGGRLAAPLARCSPTSAPTSPRRCARPARGRRRGRPRRRAVDAEGVGRPPLRARSCSTRPASRSRRSSTSCTRSSTRRSAASRRAGASIVLGTPPEAATKPAERDRAARAGGLHARDRQGDRPRRDRPARLRRAGRRGRRSPATLRFLLSPRSAFVSGQVVRIGAGGAAPAPASTGTSRSPARSRSSPAPRAASARRSPSTLARDGAHVVGLDVPALEDDLKAVAAGIGGSALALDITDAGRAGRDRRAPEASSTEASTSSSTTPASRATARSGAWTPSAGTRSSP